MITNLSEVLVVLLCCLLLGHDHDQGVHRAVPSPHHDPQDPTMDHLHRHGPDRPDWPSFLLCHTSPVHANLFLLGQILTNRIVHQCRHHHRPDVPLQRRLRHLRLRVRYLTRLPCVGPQHVLQHQTRAGSHPGYGMCRQYRSHVPHGIRHGLQEP